MKVTSKQITPHTIATVGVSVLASQIVHIVYDVSPRVIFDRVSPSVYVVTTTELHRDPFSPRDMIETKKATGSGFSYIGKDYVITNAHVIEDSFDVKVNGESATLVGTDTRHDIAVLKLDNPSTAPVLNKCSDPAHIGDPVVAIGNPFGFEKSMSAGVISGLQRLLDADTKFPLVHMLQTDADINPGNSGGPLLNAKTGCVYGMNTAVVGNVGFATPIDTIDKIAKDIIEEKEPSTIHLGISLLPDTFASGLEIKGVIVNDVYSDGLGSELGLIGTKRDTYGRPIIGDIITEINNVTITKQSELLSVLDNLTPDDPIEMKVIREDGIQTLGILRRG